MSNKFRVPEQTLKQLSEFSGGGYILFIYDQNSAPKVYADFDSPAHGLGMQKFMQNWLSIVDTLNLETSIEEITNGGNEEPPESEDEEKS